MQRLIQSLVLRSNRCWPFSRLNRWAYHAATALFVQAYRSMPEIRSIFLRHSLTGQDWEPGVSDIDLTVVLDPTLGADREFEVLHRFWHRYRRLKKRLPMLGEVDVLREDQISSWTRHTIRGFESSTWELLHGVDGLVSSYRGDERETLNESRRQALTTYAYHFLPRVYEHPRPDLVARRELHRLARKILRYARPQNAPECDTDLGEATQDSCARLVANVLSLLESVSVAPVGSEPRPPPPGERDSSPDEPDAERDFWRRALAEQQNAVRCVARLSGTLFVLIEKDIEDAQLESCVAAILRSGEQSASRPMIATPKLFAQLIRTYYGLHYYHRFRVQARILLGEHPIDRIEPPTPVETEQLILGQTGNVLTAARSQELFDQCDRLPVARALLEVTRPRALLIRLLLEKGEVSRTHAELIAAGRRRFPEYFDLEESESADKTALDADSVRRHFDLLRTLGADVHRAIASADRATQEARR